VRCCKLDNGKINGLKFQEYYNVSMHHDQTNRLKTNLFLNSYTYCLVEHEEWIVTYLHAYNEGYRRCCEQTSQQFTFEHAKGLNVS